MNGLFSTFKKLGGWSLLNLWRKAGVLPYAVAQVCLTGVSRKSLEIVRLGVQQKILHKLRKRYLPVLEAFDEEWKSGQYATEQESCPRVWICWMQGIENAPKLVQDCYSSIQEHITDRKIVLITAKNRKEYVVFPDYIEQKYEAGIITHTHFSDLLRLAIINVYNFLSI